eukprot:1589820-Pleurochrysis_carterae.AAC.3
MLHNALRRAEAGIGGWGAAVGARASRAAQDRICSRGRDVSLSHLPYAAEPGACVVDNRVDRETGGKLRVLGERVDLINGAAKNPCLRFANKISRHVHTLACREGGSMRGANN